MNRITLEQAEQVRIEAAKGINDRDLAAQYGVSERVIRDCRLGNRYKKANGPIVKRTKLSDGRVRDMREEASNTKVSFRDLAEKYGVSVSYVSLVVRGKRRAKAGGPISEPRHRWFSVNSHI